MVGGSIIRGLQAAGCAAWGWDHNQEVIASAQEAGIAVTSSAGELAQTVDVLLIAVPLDAIEQTLLSVAEAVGGDQRLLVTDVCSVKEEVVRIANRVFRGTATTFVGGHPMAGTEHVGFNASFVGLFESATWVLCESENSSLEDICRVGDVALTLGARLTLLEPAMHDESVAAISHIPYLAAAAQALILDHVSAKPVALRLAAGSFRDGTRVTGSDPDLSEGMLSHNSKVLLDLTPFLVQTINSFESALSSGDRATVHKLFEAAAVIRQEFLATKAPVPLFQREILRPEALNWLRNYCEGGGLVHSMDLTDVSLFMSVEGLDEV